MPAEAPAVKREVTVPADPDTLWAAITERLGEWLAAEVELDVREGGEGAFRFADGHRRRATVESVEDGERLVFRWQRDDGEDPETRVELVVEPLPRGSRLVVVESRVTVGPTAFAGAAGARTGGPPATAGGTWALRLALLELLLDETALVVR